MIKITGAKSAAAIKASQQGLQVIGKTLELGKEYTLLFPKLIEDGVRQDDIAMAGIIGRTTSFDDLRMSFVRIPDKDLEQNSETQRITDKSALRKWGVVSSILYKAAEFRDIENAKRDAADAAERQGVAVDETALAQAIENIRVQYNGRKSDGQNASVLPTKRRLIKSGTPDILLFTEAIIIPLDGELKPEWEKAQAVEVTISNAKLKCLQEILKRPAYNDPESDFYEVKFSYVGKDKKEAGGNKYTGLEAVARKVNMTKDAEGKFVDQNVQSIASKLAFIAHDGQTIFNRSNQVTFAKTPEDFEAAIRKFLADAKNNILTTYIDMESDQVKKGASILDELKIFNENSKQYKELQEVIKSVGTPADDATNPVEELHAAATELAGSTGVSQAANVVDENPELAATIGAEDLGDL